MALPAGSTRGSANPTKPVAPVAPVDPLVTQANRQAVGETNAALAALPSSAFISGLGQALQKNLQNNQLTQEQTAEGGGRAYHDAFAAGLAPSNAAMIGAGGPSGASETVGAANLLQAMGANNAAALGGQGAAAAAQTKNDLYSLGQRQSAIRSGQMGRQEAILGGLQKAKYDSLYKNALLSLKEQGLQIQAARAARGGGGGGGSSSKAKPGGLTTSQRNAALTRAYGLYKSTAASNNQYITRDDKVLTVDKHGQPVLDSTGNQAYTVQHNPYPNPNYHAGDNQAALARSINALINYGMSRSDAYKAMRDYAFTTAAPAAGRQGRG